MSDYEVSLVNDNMQEFYVRFYGPAESAYRRSWGFGDENLTHFRVLTHSTIRWGCLEDSRRVAGPVPFQVTQYRFHEQDLPPKY